MRVAIVGVGALGSVYGARLARLGCEVDAVGRSAGPPVSIRLERIDDGEVIDWTGVTCLDRVPPEADLALVAVRYEALDEAMTRVARSLAPVVVMTPLLPDDYARLSQAVPGRLHAAMPSVVAYKNRTGTIRYWLPRGATTLVEPSSPAGVEAELVDRLARAEIAARLDRDVLSRNVATTVSFMPMAMAIDVAGGVDAALRDDALVALALEATREGGELGRALGKAEPWASILLRFLAPFMLKAGVALARSRVPEAVAYADEHFGRKLRSQNVAIGRRMVQLAREKGTRRDALERLLDRMKGG
jgi:ketopantoate reductase